MGEDYQQERSQQRVQYKNDIEALHGDPECIVRGIRRRLSAKSNRNLIGNGIRVVLTIHDDSGSMSLDKKKVCCVREQFENGLCDTLQNMNQQPRSSITASCALSRTLMYVAKQQRTP